MKFSFSSVPEITSDIVKKSKFSVTKFSAYYFNSEEKIPLTIGEDKVLSFSDENGLWSVEDSGLNIELEACIKQPQFLFSSGGVARPGDCLGIAIRLSSASSRQRMVFGSYPVNITNSDEYVEFNCLVNISPGKLRGKAILEVLLYVKSSIIGTKPGTILGVMKTYTLSFEGDGSMFPLITDSSNEPYLWKLEMIYDDIRKDSFAECVRILINTRNPNYGQLHFDKDPLKSGLFIDIIINATVLLIQKAKEDPYFHDIENNNGLEEGSIGQAVYEILQGYVNRYGTVTEMLEAVQKKVYETLGGTQ